jgi:hypothetical protein
MDGIKLWFELHVSQDWYINNPGSEVDPGSTDTH